MRRVIFISLILIGMLYGNSIKDLEAECKVGNMLSCGELGLLYLKGEGVKKDAKKAFKLFKKACDGGIVGACNNVGTMYSKGKELKKI